MRLSVLLCTYQRHELLQHALCALLDRTIEKPDEVVIVNGGDDRADSVVAGFVNRHPGIVKLLKTKNVNLATSRNVGLPHCSGDVIAMTDDDAMVFPDWITAMKRAHVEHPEAGAVGGAVIGTNTESLVGKVADVMTFPCWPSGTYVQHLPGVNISYKREAIHEIGPQDENLRRGEDVDYNWRLLLLGRKIYFDPNIKVYHYHRPNLTSLLRQFYMYGRSYYVVRSKWPDMYSIYPHGIRRVKDVLKAVNVFATVFYGPFLRVGRMPSRLGRLQALPVVFMIGLAWRAGIASEMLTGVSEAGRK